MKIKEILAVWSERNKIELPLDETFDNYYDFEEIAQERKLPVYPTFDECNHIANEIFDKKLQGKTA
ncbi:MAG: hypothetical protein M9949_04625 [Candidatus Kapabacteria bacterium]|nr:hypothetical protein [Candidatus Kapabacteria bacterium]